MWAKQKRRTRRTASQHGCAALHLILVAANADSRATLLVVGWKGGTFSGALPAMSVAKFRWRP
jgi:hypothetical protein